MVSFVDRPLQRYIKFFKCLFVGISAENSIASYFIMKIFSAWWKKANAAGSFLCNIFKTCLFIKFFSIFSYKGNSYSTLNTNKNQKTIFVGMPDLIHSIFHLHLFQLIFLFLPYSLLESYTVKSVWLSMWF